jgi:hypothetical protein
VLFVTTAATVTTVFHIVFTFQELGLYYDGNSGTYYYYDDKSKAFQFHSQVEGIHRTPPPSSYDVTCTSGVKYEEHESKRRSKHKGNKVSNIIFKFPVLTFLLS